jgi:hypothetical protein
MKALGVALATCCVAVLWPSAAHANPIGAHVGAVTCALGAPSGLSDADDATFTRENGMDQSLHFANTGFVAAFNDERTALADLIAVEGLGVDLHKELTLALRTPPNGHAWAKGDAKNDNDNGSGKDNDNDADNGPNNDPAPPMPHTPKLDNPLPHGPALNDPPAADPPTSATPEPGSIVLLATGLVALVCLRRRIFA